MKGIINISCASQAATSIRRFTNMDEGSSSITTIRLGGGRAIDRYNPIIRDASRTGKLCKNTISPSSSNEQPAITPKSSHDHPKNTSRKKKHIFSNSKENIPNIFSISSFTKQSNIDEKRKSSTSVAATHTTTDGHDSRKTKNIVNAVASSGNNDRMIKKKSSWSCTNPGEFFSPPGSSRYLLTSTDDHQKSINLPDSDPLLLPPPPSLLPSAACKPKHNDGPSASPPTRSSHQVVVALRVSLHCKGCERKMRKHLSRMEGVTSFDIDFAAKKLTVRGDVTPLAVLASVSKVKNAQLLTRPLPTSRPPACSETNKDIGVV